MTSQQPPDFFRYEKKAQEILEAYHGKTFSTPVDAQFWLGGILKKFREEEIDNFRDGLLAALEVDLKNGGQSFVD